MNKRAVVTQMIIASAAFILGCNSGVPSYSGPSSKKEVSQAIRTKQSLDPRGGVEGPPLKWRDGDYSMKGWIESQQQVSQPPTYLLGVMFSSSARNYVDRVQKSGGGSVDFYRGQFQGSMQDYQEVYIVLTLDDLRSAPISYELIGHTKTFKVQFPKFYYAAFVEKLEGRDR